MFQYFNQLSAQSRYYVLDFDNTVTFFESGLRHIYLTQGTENKIMRSDLDGLGVETFSLGLNFSNVYEDDLGNIYVTGGISSDAYLVKMSSLGTIAWQKKIESVGLINQIRVDSQGNVYLVIVDKLIKLDSTGSEQWQKQVTVSGESFSLTTLVIDSNDDIFVSGRYISGNFTYNYLIKFDDTGSKLAEFIGQGSGTGNILRDLQVDSSDNLYGGSGISLSPTLVKFDNSLSKQFEYTYTPVVTGQAHYYTKFTIYNDLIYLINSDANGNGSSYIKINSSGTVTSKQLYNSSATGDVLSGISITDTGTLHLLGNNQFDFSLPVTIPLGTETFDIKSVTFANITTVSRASTSNFASITGTSSTISTSSLTISTSTLTYSAQTDYSYTRYALNY